MNNKATNKTNKFHWWPIIKLALTVFVILAIIDPSLFFDMTPTPEPKVKLNTYWIKNEKGEEVTLIANYGGFKFSVNKKDFEHVGRSSRSDSIQLHYYWKADPNDKIIIDTRKDVWFNNKKLNVLQRVKIIIRYDSRSTPSLIKKTKLVYSATSPPSQLYQKKSEIPSIGASEEYFYKYNGKEESIYCIANESCTLRIYSLRGITLYAKFFSPAFFYWDTFSKELFQILDQIIIEPGEVEYQINNTGN